MSLHKLTAGDGYTYLTRQVAAQDATQRGFTGLGDYYAQRGESPGLWMGRGADGLPDFPATSQVTEAQMVALFGKGLHPDAEMLEAKLLAAGIGASAAVAATRLGTPYKVFDGVNEFRRELAIRFEAWNAAAGLPRDWPIPHQERSRIRTELGRELFVARFDRPPADARELSGLLARESRQRTTAVAGYDLTFSPVKSVSALWAVAPRELADQIEAAHQAAVADTLGWLEDSAAFTRLGRNGVQQVEVRGLIAAAFTHRDSRAGDPDLHTHVAISNKVQTRQGRWLALDGRPLHKLTVAASERHNTRLEAHLVAAVGVSFSERPGEAGKRPVREIVGVPEALNRAWSARRASIDVRRAELSATFQADHGRPPGPIEAVKLAQQATLETRQGKHAPRTHAEQRHTWRSEAISVLGDERAIVRMINTVQAQDERPPSRVTPDWVADAAESVLVTVQSQRATWQEAHVRAEAERCIRSARIGLHDVDDAVERIVAAALSPALSMALGTQEPVSEPAALRRSDGTSVYVTAGTQLYTSSQIVTAERSLLATAQRGDGRVTSAGAVELALLESAARGTELNPGQAQLVRELATSGLRLQLALAPAGTGKTTAMAVLARAWAEDGGTVVGLAPSAAAAAVLGTEMGVSTDTLAKLSWSLDRLAADSSSLVPSWVTGIGPSTLVIVDEAGMAGTTELARVVAYVVGKGGSVRLVGDDQQLAAIGAGGVLRDLAEQTTAVTLSQVVRFTDPSEGAASLALRAGDDAALGFYLDAHRIHVGDPGTVADLAYEAWASDQTAGHDSVMLAPTRDLVATLNARARVDRLASAAGPVGLEAKLADGSHASEGDVVISRRNDRRLPITATDWVKNGDRWTVNAVLSDGGLTVTHMATRRRLTLPTSYVRQHVALGYASTVHGAQGVTAEHCHTIATGAETRQLLYVAMTRGRSGNHAYLSTAGDGNAHSVITPDALLPPTAVDLLTRVLARDGAQTSATTRRRELSSPFARLAAAADRFHDSVTTAAHIQLGAERLEAIDAAAEDLRVGLTDCPAYPTLRSHLALSAVGGDDPVAMLRAAADRGDLSNAADAAAVLDWRLEPAHPCSTDAGPLPWLPVVPSTLAANVTWARYLTARNAHVTELAGQVATQARQWTPTSAPDWAAPLVDRDPELLAQLGVWRAAHAVPDNDRRPTGPAQRYAADVRVQRSLNRAVAAVLGDPAATTTRWAALASAIEPRLLTDPYWPQLADRLAAVDRAGIDISALASAVGSEAPLPDELPAAALWWRLSRHLSPAVLNAHDAGESGTALRPLWSAAFVDLVGAEAGRRVLSDPAWPALVAAVTDAAGAGWGAEQVLGVALELLTSSQGNEVRPDELATALLWRVATLSEPEPEDHDVLPPPPDPTDDELRPPEDLDELEVLAFGAAVLIGTAEADLPPADADWLASLHPPAEEEAESTDSQPMPTVAGTPDPTNTAFRDRLLQLNQQALAFFTSQYSGSWAAGHLRQRLGDDLAGDLRVTPGYAPAGWTVLTDHLRLLGASDAELLAAGLGSTARTGRVIDRFRDRLVLPIRSGDEVRGFIGRRNPDTPEAGPKYLNTPQTEVFDKGQLLYGLTEGAASLEAGAIPVLVEGPLDALAVTLATRGDAVGVAPLGTAFTERQAELLRPYLGETQSGVIVATDGDRAGRQAAVRAFWRLSAQGGNPRHLVLPDGTDPADLLQTSGPEALTRALADTPSLARSLIDARLATWSDQLHTAEGLVLSVRSVAEVIGALRPSAWLEHIGYVESLVHALPGLVHLEVLDAGHAWTLDPDGATRRQLMRRLDTSEASPSPRFDRTTQDGLDPGHDVTASEVVDAWAAKMWGDVGRSVDPRLVASADWPGLAAALERAHRAGYDVQGNLSRLAQQVPLPEEHAARALHYRLVQECEAAISPVPTSLELSAETAGRASSRPTQQPQPRPSVHAPAPRR